MSAINENGKIKVTESWWEPRRNVRKREIAALRAEGAETYRAGRHLQSNPYKFMDAMQWTRGWEQEREPR